LKSNPSALKGMLTSGIPITNTYFKIWGRQN
jgi:hypothetical protein